MEASTKSHYLGKCRKSNENITAQQQDIYARNANGNALGCLFALVLLNGSH